MMTSDRWSHPQAKWIGLAGTEDATNLFLDFVRRFDAAGENALTIAITAASRFILYLNGQEIARGPAVSDHTLRYFHQYTLPPELLQEGENLLAVRLHHDGAATETIQEFEYGRPGLLAAVQGGNVDVVSDQSWQVRRSTVFSGNSLVSKWGGYKEFYHGEHEDAWRSLSFDHSEWAAAAEWAAVTDPTYAQQLRRVTLPELQKTTLAPQQIVDVHHNLGLVETTAASFPAAYDQQPIRVEAKTAGAAPAILLDFGREVVGFPEIHIAGGFCIYELWYGESLDLYRYDVVRTADHGRWQAFHRRAFRYLQIKFIALPQPITLTDVVIHDTRYAYDESGHLDSSDSETNKIIAVSKETLRANTSFHYEDCPWREQALWVFDMRVMALQNYYFYGDGALVRKNLRQMFALQQPDGSIPSTGPLDNGCYNLDFCMHLVATLREYYCYTGDKALLVELDEAVDKLHQYLMTQVADDGLMTTEFLTRGGAFLDWSTEIQRGPKTVILNALYARYLEDMIFIKQVQAAEIAPYEDRLRKLVPLAVMTFYDAQKGLFADTITADGEPLGYSLQGNMAAIYGRFIEGSAAQQLVDRSAGFKPPYSPAYYFIVFEALASIGRFDEIDQHIGRYWGGMLAREAITWWEVFDPDTPDWVYPHPFLGNLPTYEMDWIPSSACHGWSGTAGLAIPRQLLGIDLLQLWQNKLIIRPGLAGHYESFSYRVPLRGGHLAVKFVGNGAQYQIELLEAPEGLEVIVEQQVHRHG